MMLIQKYTAIWVDQFIQLKQLIDEALNGINYTVAHVGSTSVPDLDAKAIIDIDIIYDDITDFETIKTRLQNIGYSHNGDQGIEKREVFKRFQNLNHPFLDAITHHLYVCINNSEALDRHLLFRDFLRRNQEARLKYQTMKYAIAEKVDQNRKAYAVLKEQTVNDFIDECILQQKAFKNLE